MKQKQSVQCPFDTLSESRSFKFLHRQAIIEGIYNPHVFCSCSWPQLTRRHRRRCRSRCHPLRGSSRPPPPPRLRGGRTRAGRGRWACPGAWSALLRSRGHLAEVTWSRSARSRCTAPSSSGSRGRHNLPAAESRPRPTPPRRNLPWIGISDLIIFNL